MGVNSLPKTVTRQRRGYDLNPGPSAPESSTLTTRLPSHPGLTIVLNIVPWHGAPVARAPPRPGCILTSALAYSITLFAC